MYVNRLIEYAERNAKELIPLGFKRKKIQWVADIENDKILLTQLGDIEFQVPDITRSSGAKPILFVDKADYVFAVSDTKSFENRSKERHESYLALLDAYLEEHHDLDVKKLRGCFENMDLIDEEVKEKGVKMNDFISFRIRDDEFLHEKEDVKKFWGAYIQPETRKNHEHLACMFCGEIGSVMDRHTINFLIGPNRTKLISANENAYESHGLKNSNGAPTCYDCEQKYGKALEHLLAGYKGNRPGGPHMFRLGELTFVHWIRSETQLEDGFNMMLMSDKSQGKQDMQDLIEQVFKGQAIERELKDFCILTLSANKARLVVRNYVEDSAAHLKERIKTFFTAQDIGADRYYGIYTLAATMYTDASKQMQKFVLEEWMDWFLHGKPLSSRILIPLLKQIQVSGTMHAHHAAAVKSWLISQYENKDVERGGNKMALDRESENPAYVIGRLFAVLEKIQQEAINPTNTIATKYFAAASTTPKSVIGILIRNAQHHLAKLGSDDDRKGLAVYYDRRLGEVYGRLNDYPEIMNAEGQAEFAMGYYHEKQDLYTSNKAKREGVGQDDLSKS